MSHRKTFSQDSACDSSADIDYGTKRDDASIYSHKSTTSSVFSTASRISRIPSAVKSSVKYLVRRNKSKHHDDTFLSQIDHESLGSKIKRSTINFNPFRKNHQDTTHLTHEIIPNTTISSSLYTSANSNSSNTTLSSTSHYSQLSSKPTRQNSIARVASRLSSKSEKVPHHLDNEKEGVSTSKSLFGKQADDFDFLLPQSDSKSEKMAAKKREEPWMRQRAKSCQENNSPMLRQLATKGSSTKLVVDLPQSTGPLPYKANHKSFDLPHFKDLVTTTLTTLHTRLTNECDRTISMMLSAKNNPSSDTFNPKENLLSIISDLYKMTTMVNWENRDKEDQVKLNIQQLEKTITHDELNLISVKDIVSTIKQIMNQCICQYYGTVEKAIVIPSKGYRIEGINKYGDLSAIDIMPIDTVDYSKSAIDHKDTEAHWYRTYFMNDLNTYTFFGYNHDKEPVLISIKNESETEEHSKQFRTIYRTQKHPDQRRIITDSFLLNASVQNGSLKHVVEAIAPEVSFDQLYEMSGEQMISTGLHDELVRLDENSLHPKHKFGVLLVKEGQTKEEEWLSNENDSEAFDEFLGIIGRKVELQGYTGWAAGLDTKGGDSGEFTYTNEWNDDLLAYHVSTLIPSKESDRQQIQRKRHIGNDIVCLVFVEGNQPFNPTAIKSQFLHVFIVVHKETWKDQISVWRVEVVSIEDVPTFGPPLPSKSAVFFDKKELETFLVAKLVNAEYAALKSPKFSVPINRAREGILTNIVEKVSDMSEEEQASNTVTEAATITEKDETVKKHRRSASVSSQSDTVSPSPSKSNVIREISENIVNLGRRRSTQELNERPKNSNSKQLSNKKSSGRNKFNEGSKRSRSEQDLMNVTIDHTVAKQSFKNRAQNILTSIPGFGSGNGQDKLESAEPSGPDQSS